MSSDLECATAIARDLGLDAHGLRVARIGGGDIARSLVVQAADAWVFVKMLPPGQNGILSAEADGLEALRQTRSVRVPRVIKRAVTDEFAWLALEYLNLDERSADTDARLGEQLAALHRNSSDTFGWHRNNFLGRTPQPNPPGDNWNRFFARNRLAYQFDRLQQKQSESRWRDLKDAVVAAWVDEFGDHNPPPALIHGDLWRGNAASVGRNDPVVFDPAVHYADRECDLAMTHLFGGFAPEFYAAYNAAWPLPDGYRERWQFYKLYHLLNHANLFGGSYLRSVGELADRILTEHR